MKSFENVVMILAALMSITIGFNFWLDYKESQYFEENIHREVDTAIIQEKSKIDTILVGVKEDIDSANSKINGLAEIVIYLDSCQQNRTNKANRADRRGRFVGGVLKGLFPNL